MDCSFVGGQSTLLTLACPVLQLHIGDGIHLVHKIAKRNLEDLADFLAASHISENSSSVVDERFSVIIIDADAGDSRYAFYM